MASLLMYAPFAIIALIIVAIVANNYIVSTVVSLLIIAIFIAYLTFDIQRLKG